MPIDAKAAGAADTSSKVLFTNALDAQPIDLDESKMNTLIALIDDSFDEPQFAGVVETSLGVDDAIELLIATDERLRPLQELGPIVFGTMKYSPSCFGPFERARSRSSDGFARSSRSTSESAVAPVIGSTPETSSFESFWNASRIRPNCSPNLAISASPSSSRASLAVFFTMSTSVCVMRRVYGLARARPTRDRSATQVARATGAAALTLLTSRFCLGLGAAAELPTSTTRVLSMRRTSPFSSALGVPAKHL